MSVIEQLKAYAAMTDVALDRFVPAMNDMRRTIADAMRYSLLCGGKRLRPALMMAFCQISGGDAQDALPFACALEMIHTFSLIHDDLPCMDDDDLRRGRPTNHKVYGEAMAVLAGDGLLNAAYELVFNPEITGTLPAERVLRAAYELSHCSGIHGMLGGQAVDVETDGHLDSAQALLDMYARKTGALLRAACRMGCILAGADEAQLSAADCYAAKLGLAFQIQDDILDVEGDVALLGKNTSHDAQTHKSTYPAVFGMDAAKAAVQTLTQEAKQALMVFENRQFLEELADYLTVRQN